MEAPNLRNVTPEAWGDMMGRLIDSRKGESQGHLYVYIDAKQQVRLLEAQDSGNLTQLGLEKLIPLTMQIMMQCSDQNVRMRSHIEEMTALLMQHQVKPEPKMAPKVVRVEQQVLAPAVGAMQAVPHYAISAERLDTLESCLAANPKQLMVTRSHDGRDGAFFFSHPDLMMPRTVVKFCFDTHKHLLADQLIAKFFDTPRYESLTSHATLGEKVRQNVSRLVQTPMQSRLTAMQEGFDGKDHQQRLEIANLDRITSGLGQLVKQEIVAARYIKGTAFKDLMAFDRASLLSSPKFLQSLGQMIAVDTFMHNTDRIAEYQCNKGNFMIQGQGDARVLVPIDHDFAMSKETLPMIKEGLTRLLQGDGLENRLRLLLTSEDNGEKKIQEMVPQVRQGVEDACKKLIELFATDDDCKKVFTVPARADHANVDAGLIREVVQHLRGLL